MNPAKFSIAKPVTILMASLAVLVLGATSFMQLKTDLLPDITFPVIAIITSYPGTPPEEIEEFVTKPLEEAAATVADYKSVRSISRESVSIVIVDFDWGRDMDWAAFDTREKVDPVIERLPTGVRRPVIMKLDPGTLMPVLTINVTGMEDMKRLRQIAEDDIKPELEKLPGVAAANVYGGLQREIQVEVDRGRLQAHGLSVAQIEGALQRANVNIPTGFTTEGPKEYTIRLVGQFQSVEEIGDLVIADRGGVPIYLRNIATVLDTHAEVRSYARVNGDPCVSLSIVKESIANTVEVSQAVQDAVSTLPDKLPLGLEMTITHNQADFIESSLDNLYSVAIEGAVLALLIIFVFLATLRGTLIGGISIPLSLLATFALMYFSDMTLNIVTMGGLVLAIGRLVDDSVVVLENIYRHVEEGEPVVDAAINGTGELSMAIFAVTLATMCVFFPVMYVGGLISTLFTPMSMVVIFGLACSLVVALTVIPTLSVRMIPPRQHSEDRQQAQSAFTRFVTGFNRALHSVSERYSGVLKWCLHRRSLVVAIALAVFIVSLMLIPLVGFEFFPTMDEGEMQLTLEAPVGSSIEYTNSKAKEVEEIVRHIPELENMEVTLGEGEGMAAMSSTARSANFQIGLVDRHERRRSTAEIQDELREQLSGISGVTYRFQLGRGGMGSDLEITIRGDDLRTLSSLADEAVERTQDIPGLHDLKLDWEPGAPEYQIRVDRDKAGRVGLSAAEVAGAVQTLVRGTQELTKYREGGKEYDIMVRAREMDRQWIDMVRATDLVTATGSTVPLTEVATITETVGPTQISRTDRERTVTIGCTTSKRALSEIVVDAEKELEAMTWPEGYSYEFGGAEEDRQEAFGGMGLALIIGVLLIYIILASLFESTIHPFTIMLAIPLQVIGVFAALLLTGTPVNIMVMLGILMLTGIVVSNSILLVQMVNVLRERGLQLEEAITEGGRIRLRPILMTALATIFAMIPLALGFRSGSEMWQPMAISVIGGLVTSTLLTLLVVPVAYSLMDGLSRKIGWLLRFGRD
jgi:HAE1 family hydrophobic/amphiphilic exporter-1